MPHLMVLEVKLEEAWAWWLELIIANQVDILTETKKYYILINNTNIILHYIHISRPTGKAWMGSATYVVEKSQGENNWDHSGMVQVGSSRVRWSWSRVGWSKVGWSRVG